MEFNPTTLVVLTALITAVSTLIGVSVTSYFNLRTTRLTKESEERKHHKEIVIKAAIENWKQVAELLLKSYPSFEMPPLEIYLLHMSKTADIIFDPSTDVANIKQRMDEVSRILDVVSETKTSNLTNRAT